MGRASMRVCERTIPMPSGVQLASTFAQRTALTASDTAVSKPNERSITGKSLSMVLGTQATLSCMPCCVAAAAIDAASRCDPSPPTTNRTLNRRRRTPSVGRGECAHSAKNAARAWK